MGKMTLTNQRKLWKGEGIALASVVAGFMATEKANVNHWERAVRYVVGNGITKLEAFQVAVEQANNETLQVEMDNLLNGATTEKEINVIEVDFIHQKNTAQHEKGSFKTSILPNAWRTSISVIGSCLTYNIPLVVPVREKGVIVGYKIATKSALDGLIKVAKTPAAVTDPDVNGNGEVNEVPESITLNPEDNAITRLEACISAARHIIGEIDDEQELAIAHAMVDTIWDLSPMKVSAQA